MKVLICSLQVSAGASKGHLHPAIEIGLTLRSRGHHVGILPLPSQLSQTDREQVTRCQLEIVDPPPLPAGLPFSPEKLAEYAQSEATIHLAFESFILTPLNYQFDSVVEKINNFRPDIIIYDLLVYAPALAARLLGIPDIGYCAGLKLIAPPDLTTIYQSIYEKLAPRIHSFLNNRQLEAEFHQLELLSRHYQVVFTPDGFTEKIFNTNPTGTILAGALPTSDLRLEQNMTPHTSTDDPLLVLCFGSVFDPADFPGITQQIIDTSEGYKLNLLIATRKPHLIASSKRIITVPYLALPQLLQRASIFVHHGGANTFSESLKAGTPQLLIPLSSDQPIQAEILKRSKTGIALYPREVTDENLRYAFDTLLDKTNPIHQKIRLAKTIYENSNGAIRMCELAEKLHQEKGSHAR